MGVAESVREVFVVDDDLGVHDALVELLSVEGYHVRAFLSAEQAWDVIERGARPGVIVLDIWLPGMSGREFVARLRASAYAAIPVVVVSGSGWTERVECGGDEVLRKPIEGRTVVRTVDWLVARGPASASAAVNPPSQPARPVGSQRPP